MTAETKLKELAKELRIATEEYERTKLIHTAAWKRQDDAIKAIEAYCKTFDN